MNELIVPESVCPMCLQRAVSRPDMKAEGVVPGGVVVRCSSCKAEYQLDRFIAPGDRVRILGRGPFGRVLRRLAGQLPAVEVLFGDGRTAGFLYSELSREGVCCG